MQLPQSTVSRHLKALADSGWVSARAEGTSHLYTMTRDELDAVGAPALAAGPRAGRADAGGGAGSAAAAGGAGRAAHQVAGVLLVVRRPVGSPARRAVRRPLPPRGAGGARRAATGWSAISAAAPVRSARRSRRLSRSVIAVDASAAMLQAAQASGCSGFDNVDLRRGELEALPIDDARLDAATLMLVLHHVPEPATRAGRSRARAQAGRPRCSSSTCCRTIARATGSRWATSGSGSRTSTCDAC